MHDDSIDEPVNLGVGLAFFRGSRAVRKQVVGSTQNPKAKALQKANEEKVLAPSRRLKVNDGGAKKQKFQDEAQIQEPKAQRTESRTRSAIGRLLRPRLRIRGRAPAPPEQECQQALHLASSVQEHGFEVS
jgi:hypothetical protein